MKKSKNEKNEVECKLVYELNVRWINANAIVKTEGEKQAKRKWN